MLAKNVNDNACLLNERGACEFFASKLAPTGKLPCVTGKYLTVTNGPYVSEKLFGYTRRL
ncbi:hypothetical protein C7A10_02040 [Pseudomonas fluorescens]|uniref:Uncharacterized protein n=1 Tax=Pseudomonas fluorescens TaxID=294 RepID=A0A2T0IJ11_PSEFL|nr:hypothetical protein C7A10_02040 [Pseudomonas fluorescens]